MTTRVDFNELPEFEKKLREFINDNAEIVAKAVASEAKAKIKSKTGMLKRRIRAKKSRFDDGGWIVTSGAPHSWVVENGHGGPKPAPAHPFLRPALNENINRLRQLMGAT
jgi:HK97 gp10 family phage protein